MTAAPKFCTQCGFTVGETDKFCSQCGYGFFGKKSEIPSLRQVSVSLKQKLLLAGIVVSFSVAVISFQSQIIGSPPSQVHAPLGDENQVGTIPPTAGTAVQPAVTAAPDPEVDALKAELQINPKSVPNLKQLATLLWAKVPVTAEDGPAPQEVVLDLVDTLGKLLAIDPKDEESLLMMANLNFNQQVFGKSAEYFKKYLELHPDDIKVRASYASNLTFLGHPEQALAELEVALKKDPKSFQANAFKSITLAQMGKLDEAKAVGIPALLLAPSDEAKTRFKKFLDSLSTMKPVSAADTKKGDRGNLVTEPPVVTFLKQHPIVGPKFKSFAVKNSAIEILVENFPMQAMPPVAKEVFEKKVRDQLASQSEISAVIFKDAVTSAELATIQK